MDVDGACALDMLRACCWGVSSLVIFTVKDWQIYYKIRGILE